MDRRVKYLKKSLFILVMVLIVSFSGFVIFCKIQEAIYYKKGPLYEPIFTIYTIASDSMKPNFNKYDIVINKTVNPEEIEIGDVITFKSTNLEYSGINMTHRVVGITGDEKDRIAFDTKGDNNPQKDSSYARGHNVLGKAVFRIPLIGFFGTPYGLIIIASVLTVIIIKRKKSKKIISGR